jgi:ABC-type multidrug transport system permease subunit
MNFKQLLPTVLAAVAVLGLLVLLFRLLTGVFALASGLLNTLLGLAVTVALVAIVAWMFSYAKKRKK